MSPEINISYPLYKKGKTSFISFTLLLVFIQRNLETGFSIYVNKMNEEVVFWRWRFSELFSAPSGPTCYSWEMSNSSLLNYTAIQIQMYIFHIFSMS